MSEEEQQAQLALLNAKIALTIRTTSLLAAISNLVEVFATKVQKSKYP